MRPSPYNAVMTFPPTLDPWGWVSLAMPRLIIPSLQVNMRAGEIPTDASGRPMLKVLRS